MNKFGSKNVEIKEIIEFPVAETVKNCKLHEIKLHDATAKAGESIEFVFIQKENIKREGTNDIVKNPDAGAKVGCRLFDPTINPQTEEKSTKQFFSNLKHVVNAYIPETELNLDSVEADSFGLYIKTIKSLLDAKKEIFEIPTNLKVVYNKSNYPSLPAYPNWISTPIKPRKFTSNPDYDFYEKRKTQATNLPNLAAMDNGGIELPNVDLSGDETPFDIF